MSACRVTSLLVALVVVPAHAAVVHRTVYAMGTQLSLEVEGPDEAGLKAATEAAVRECERIEAAGSTWRDDSLFTRLNQAGGRQVAVDAEWFGLLERVASWSKETGGAFDPALGALVRAWGLRHGGRTPDAAELKAARAASGAGLLHLRGGQVWLSGGASLEEGGFLKGYALDRMAAVLRAGGATDGLLDFGGQLLAFGRAREAGVASASDRGAQRFEVALAAGSLSTSGTSVRGRHLLDPRTGERSPAWGSVSVFSQTGLDADVLSTALYVLGPVDGLAWAEQHHVAALFQPFEGPAVWSPAFASHLFPGRSP